MRNSLAALTLITFSLTTAAQDNAINLNTIPTDLTVPAISDAAPAAGLRVRATTAGWEGTAVHHTLYLPTDWAPGKTFPVIAEYAGNGNYSNKLGDTSDGTVEGCMLGYGLSGGRGFISVVLPFVEVLDGKKQNAVKWWGDVTETKRYCLATMADICARYGGNSKRLVLTGFSRGAIACNYIGLHDDEIASLWCGMLCHSHYDGEFKHPAPDNDAWPERLRRLGSRPQFIMQEGGTQKTQEVIQKAGVTGNFIFAAFPYPNHTARWALCDLPARHQAREWLADLIK